MVERYAIDGEPEYNPHGDWVSATDYDAEVSALREKLEAAETAKFRLVTERNAMEAERNDARAGQAAAWEAARDAAAEQVPPSDLRNQIRALTPPADLSTALQAVKDAEWDAALEAAAGAIFEPEATEIRALRRAAFYERTADE